MAYINLGQVIYPVGAIYASANSTSPASLLGGSWTQITNAALRGATSVGYTGSDTHILTIKEMPSHIHNMKYGSAPQASTGQYAFVDRDMNDSFSTQWREPSALQSTGGGSTYQRATLLQLLRLATYKLNLQEVMLNGYTSNIL